MQLHYNIIWIDDEIHKFEETSDIARINEFIYELGFVPYVLSLKEGKNIDKYFIDKNFDLIISDYNIEEGHDGDEIIRTIRGKKVLSEVLFYSSQTELQQIAERLLTVDRISFHSGRRGLIDKIETMIELSVSKLLELNPTRGLITAETSELDVIIEELVMDIVFNKLKLDTEGLDKIIHEYVNDFLSKAPTLFMTKYSEHGFKKWFHKIEANRKWLIFRDLLKKIGDEPSKKFLERNKKYGDEVIGIRNKFAHSKAITHDGKLCLAGFGFDGKPFEFDNDSCINIRKNLLSHREAIIELAQHLGVQIDT